MINNLIATDHVLQARGLMHDVVSILDETLIVSEVSISRSILWTIYNSHTGDQFRVIFDPQNLHMARHGLHVKMELDEYDLVNAIEDAADGGFDTIYLHLNL